MTHHSDPPLLPPAEFWERRYAGAAPVWSGAVNRVLADVAGSLAPGRALDLGCGEGADVIWLGMRGWHAVGVDISPSAIARARSAADAAGLDPARVRFVVSDSAELPSGTFDLVSASFFQSPVELAREKILRDAAARIAVGGHLLLTSHGAAPAWASESDRHAHRFRTPEEELSALGLESAAWSVRIAETRVRQVTSPSGAPAELEDVVVMVERV